ncbi:MAG: flavodoxin [Eubacteriales bacterium]|nr:flavodoxin [Eubacteriales bacterium]
MHFRRKIVVAALAVAVACLLAACGNTAADNAAARNQTAQGSAQNTGSGAPSDSSVLIAYFSQTGNTEEAAQRIAQYTGGDLAEIQRAEEYTDLQEEAEAEILDGVHPDITVSVEDIAQYDTIFVGYPIWWDEAPAMIATFLAENNFAGKTVVPFCTSASDSIDNSLHIFDELCPDATIAEGLTANDLDDIEPWLQALGVVE